MTSTLFSVKEIERILVQAERPTALENETSLAVPGQDLFTNFVKNVHVVPEEISLDRFKTAVAKAAARYATTSGRLIREGDNWRIDLVNEPIPIIIAELIPDESEPKGPFYPFPNDLVTQPSDFTEPFVSREAKKFLLRGDDDDPLLCIQITKLGAGRGTAIGLSWCHTLGDAKAMWDFTLCLSTLYENPKASEDQLPLAPSFYRHTYPHPYRHSPLIKENFLPRMPHFSRDFDLATLGGMYAAGDAVSDPMQIRFSGDSLDRMLEVAQPDEAGRAGLKLTIQDAMSAYLFATLNKCADNTFFKIINAVNFRSPVKYLSTAAAFTHPAASNNSLYMMYTDAIPSEHLQSIPHLARVVRGSINTAREPEFIEKWMAFASFLMAKGLNASKEGRFFFFAPEEGEMTVNSNYRFDWNAAHFGHPNASRYYTSWEALNYFRVFCSNPNPKRMSPKGTPGADVSFRLHKEIKAKFISIIRNDYPDALIIGE